MSIKLNIQNNLDKIPIEIDEYELKRRYPRIYWQLGVPYGSHQAGFYERFIRSMRNALAVVMKDTTLSLLDFQTCLTKCEMFINCRPICRLSNDPQDFRTLSPKDFFNNTISESLAPTYEKQNNPLTARYWQIQEISDQIWTRFQSEIISTLRPNNKWLHHSDYFHMNDLVLVMDINSPRNFWKKAVISKIYPNPTDGLTRVVECKLASGKKIMRPINKLIPILRCDDPNIMPEDFDF